MTDKPFNSFKEKYQFGTDNGSFMWDISAIRKKIKESQIDVPIIEFDVEELLINNKMNVNQDYAMSTNIEEPGIIVELETNKKKLIDGNHRLYKANKLGLKKFKCYYLNKELHIQFIVDYDSKKYKKILQGIFEQYK